MAHPVARRGQREAEQTTGAKGQCARLVPCHAVPCRKATGCATSCLGTTVSERDGWCGRRRAFAGKGAEHMGVARASVRAGWHGGSSELSRTLFRSHSTPALCLGQTASHGMLMGAGAPCPLVKPQLLCSGARIRARPHCCMRAWTHGSGSGRAPVNGRTRVTCHMSLARRNRCRSQHTDPVLGWGLSQAHSTRVLARPRSNAPAPPLLPSIDLDLACPPPPPTPSGTRLPAPPPPTPPPPPPPPPPPAHRHAQPLPRPLLTDLDGDSDRRWPLPASTPSHRQSTATRTKLDRPSITPAQQQQQQWQSFRPATTHHHDVDGQRAHAARAHSSKCAGRHPRPQLGPRPAQVLVDDASDIPRGSIRTRQLG